MDPKMRAAQFKSAATTKTGTDKRASEAVSLRKEKNKEKLDTLRERRLMAVPRAGGAGEKQPIASFDKQAFVTRGDLDALRTLNEIMALIAQDTDALEQHGTKLLFDDDNHHHPIVCTTLVALLNSALPIHDPAYRCALTTLVNVSGAQWSQDVRVSQALVQAGFLPYAARVLGGGGGGNEGAPNPAPNPAPLEACVWDIASNVAATCREARALVLNVLAPSLFASFARVYAPTYAPHEYALMAPTLLDCAWTLLQNPESGRCDPWLFTFALWPFALRTLESMPPLMHQSEMDEPQRMALSCALFCVRYMLRGAALNADAKPEESASRLLALVGVVRVVTLLVRTFPLCSFTNQVCVAETMVTISAGNLEFQQSMLSVPGCIDLMVSLLSNGKARLRQQAYLWMGNFMSDGSEYVALMLLPRYNVMETIINCVRGEREELVRRNAVYAFVTMFHTCNWDRVHRMEKREQSEAFMRTLVLTHTLFRWITPFVSVVADQRLACDVLNVMAAALRWDRALVLGALEDSDVPDRVSYLVAQIQHLKGSQHTPLYEAACAVDDLMGERNGEGGVDAMQLDVQAGFVAEGVYQGGFAF
jgi:hypothetical protein